MPESFELHPLTFTHVLQAIEGDGWLRWAVVPAAWLYRQVNEFTMLILLLLCIKCQSLLYLPPNSLQPHVCLFRQAKDEAKLLPDSVAHVGMGGVDGLLVVVCWGLTLCVPKTLDPASAGFECDDVRAINLGIRHARRLACCMP